MARIMEHRVPGLPGAAASGILIGREHTRAADRLES